MVRVCVHHPLNPAMSKTCMAHEDHNSEDISELEIPFSEDLHTFTLVLAKLSSSGLIISQDALSVYEQVEREKKASSVNTNEDRQFISVERLISAGQIAEIHIKYRD